jgi:2-methylcitrate dehydratase PrpD
VGNIPITSLLATFACEANPADKRVQRAGRQALANCLGLMAGACNHPAARTARSALAKTDTGPVTSVIGKQRKLPILTAALSNGISAHVEDFDDTCLPSILHPGAPVIPAALAAAEYRDVSGESLLQGVLVGMEIAIRVSDAMTPRALDRGWHVTGLTGPIGAAAAAGRIIGLSPDQMRSALSVAACQGGGVQAALGTMTKSLHPGRAAANGLEAAILSQHGLVGPTDGIESGNGLARATADWLDESYAVQALGDEWRVRTNLLKPYACGVVSHPSIAAARQIRAEAGPGTAASITRVHAVVNPLVLDVMGVLEPKTGLQAKFSVYHCIAVGLLDGMAGVRQFALSRVRSAEVVALRRLVEVTPDASCALDEALLHVEYSDGSSIERHAAPRRDIDGMPDAELNTKVHELADNVLGLAAVSELLEMVSNIGQLPDLHELTAVACGRMSSERKKAHA